MLFLLPFGRSSELPLALAGVLGVLSMATAGRARWDEPVLRLGVILFLCYWVPALLSATDAVAPERAWSTVLVDLRFLPFALALVWMLGGESRALGRLRDAAALIVGLWVLDALVQAATGTGLGGRWSGDRVSGVFGDDNLKLGPVLAVLSPLALECAWRRYGRAALAATWLALGAAILLAGARAGWVSYALVSLVYCWRAAGDVRRFVAVLAFAVASIAALAAAAYTLSDRFAARVDRTVAAGSADERGIDFALAGRLPIWHTALDMSAAHPVNGVGVRGFRYAYKDHAEPGDPWLDLATGRGAAHPHQLLLEVLAETGVIGLMAWLAGAWLAWRAYFRAAAPVRAHAFAPGLALAAMTFPLNSHFAFYSSFWALLFWWLIALYLAALAQAEPRP